MSYTSSEEEQKAKQALKEAIGNKLYEIEKIEYDENGRRLSHKPNKGFKLGSYKFKRK